MSGPTDPMPTIKSIVYPELVHPEKVDHKVEAERVLGTINPDGEATYANGMSYAQVHATLALVEQTRIANLIALGIGRESREIREGVGL